jgi:hypothetical protein
MDLRRLRAGDWIVASSGALLLATLFLPWYAGGGGTSITAWESFAVLDIIFALIAAAAVGLLAVTAIQQVPAVPVTLTSLVALGGLVATVLVVLRVMALPDGATGREWALWLGLAGSLGIFGGGLVATRDERPSPPGRHTDHTGRPAPPPPDVETIPAPRREGAA